jgi:predicted ATPase/class 3 adenylate cyclase
MAPKDFGDGTADQFLPTGTVTLLMADIEGSTRVWENQPDRMAAALATMDRTLTELVCANNGVRPVAQGEGDSFVVAFTRASDAVACALALQRAPLSPIRLRIGVHTGELQLRDEGNYMGPTINRAARLRDLGHGGQTLLSGATSDLVCELLPEGAWLTDLGRRALRDLPRPERVSQLCHPDLHNDFPPLRTHPANVFHGRPVQLTSFVGRVSELAQVPRLLEASRLLTLTGAGGVGKTRLAVEVASRASQQYRDGIWYVDLAPITDPALVPLAAARALALPDLPGRSTTDTVTRHISDRRTLLVVDNCEHLLDASAALIGAVLSCCPNVSVLATSREPIAVNGEQVWRVPSLSLDDDAIALFTERARRACSEFAFAAGDVIAVTEICRRLDGVPLAIELAASRARALSLEEIIDSLDDRFHLLVGTSRTTVHRQQTLKACVDWSYALLTEPEKVMLRRLSVFLGGFDVEAAKEVAVGGHVHSFQVVDLLVSLVDKSLLATETRCGRTRYRFSETMRQYALERLCESGEADAPSSLARQRQ